MLANYLRTFEFTKLAGFVFVNNPESEQVHDHPNDGENEDNWPRLTRARTHAHIHTRNAPTLKHLVVYTHTLFTNSANQVSQLKLHVTSDPNLLVVVPDLQQVF